MSEESFRVTLPGGDSVTAVRSTPAGEGPCMVFAYAPGAGSNVHDPFGRHLNRRLAERGIAAVRFQFPYMEAGRRRPDPPQLLEDTWRAVMDAVGLPNGRMIVGGRSMGGRIASNVVAKGAVVDGLVLFAYPLHPPGREDQARDKHLPKIGVPTLFCSGTRDAFGTPEELQAASSKVEGSRLHLLEGADHGFGTPKSAGRPKSDVWEEATSALTEWLDSLFSL